MSEDYILIESKNKREFEKIVKDHLEAGWTLQGGVAVYFGNSIGSLGERYVQALTKTISK